MILRLKIWLEQRIVMEVMYKCLTLYLIFFWYICMGHMYLSKKTGMYIRHSVRNKKKYMLYEPSTNVIKPY